MAKNGKIKLCKLIFENSKPTLEINKRIIKDEIKMMEIALDCIYNCPDIDKYDIMNDIFAVNMVIILFFLYTLVFTHSK